MLNIYTVAQAARACFSFLFRCASFCFVSFSSRFWTVWGGGGTVFVWFDSFLYGSVPFGFDSIFFWLGLFWVGLF